jgi:hypothetical protein
MKPIFLYVILKKSYERFIKGRSSILKKKQNGGYLGNQARYEKESLDVFLLEMTSRIYPRLLVTFFVLTL